MGLTKKFVMKQVSRGRTYYYFRRAGTVTRLPDNPDSPEFDRAYWALRSDRQTRVSKTTFDALITSYYQSPKFRSLKPGTQREYRRTLELIREKNGKRDFTQLKRRDVIAARDAYSDTWRKANAMVEMISVLAKLAIELEWITTNPASGVSKLTGGSYEAWPDEKLEDYERHCNTYCLTTERTVYELCIGTGQRIGDVCQMRWDQFNEGYMDVLQEKTGAVLTIYCPERLRTHLEGLPRQGRYILAKSLAEPIGKRRVQQMIRRVRSKIDADNLVIHGWRYNAAKSLAEAGCSDTEIQAVTGHKTLTMVMKYRQQANQRKLSKSAQERREQNKNET